MSNISLLSHIAAAVVLAGSAFLAHSATTVYDSQAAFLAASPEPWVDTFDTLDLDGSDKLTRAIGLRGYTATVSGGFYAVGTATDGWLSSNQALPIVFDSFTGGVSAVGGYFFASDINGDYLAGESLTVTVTDASGAVRRTLVDPKVSTFIGFVSDGSIQSLQVGVVDTGYNNAWATVNDLTLAGPVAAVPEPSSLALLLAGISWVSAATARRRRQR